MRALHLKSLGLAFILAASLAAQTPKPGVAKCGRLADQVFNCPRFGFTYKVPFGWVERTDEMNHSPDTETDGRAAKDAPRGSETLLAVFERPPGAPGETIDSAVVIVAESLKQYRGVKTAADYLGPITELAEQRGFKALNEPYEFAVGARKLARADFSKQRGKLTMWQTTLALIQSGEIISFTFVAGDESEIDDLIADLKFVSR